MIERLKLKNFQCHSELDIKFDPRITTFVGATDVGKSALIRSLKWVVLNRPLGSAFIKDGEDDCRVMLLVDGKTIVRRKGKKNYYKLNKQRFVAFGNAVPEAIQSVLQMDSLNFQEQHDAPFWFSITAGRVAEELNAIVDLNIIDEVMSKLQSKFRKAKAVADVSGARLADAEATLERFSYVPELTDECGELENLDRERQEVTKQWERLSEVVQKAATYKDKYGNLVGVVMDGEAVVKLGAACTSIINRCQRLSDLVNRVVDIEKKRNQPIPDITPLEEQKLRLEGIEASYVRLKERVVLIQKAQKDLQRKKEALLAERKRLKQFVGLECPVCGNKINQ